MWEVITFVKWAGKNFKTKRLARLRLVIYRWNPHRKAWWKSRKVINKFKRKHKL